VYDFIACFNAKYCPNQPFPFHAGSFDDARELARSMSRLLLIYLHDDSVDECEVFCR